MKNNRGKLGQQDTATSLRQKVYAEIKHDILTCKLEPGEPLSENQFVERFQVSKTPIREALTSLQQDHLVEYVANRGFMVTPISVRDVQEIFEAREFYETVLYKLALKRITKSEIEELDAYSKVKYDLNDSDAIDLYLEANREFHLQIAKIAGNSRLSWHYASLLDEAQRLIYLDFKNSNILLDWTNSHQGLLEALKNMDEQAGIQSIKETLEFAKRRVLGTN